jgi:citrate lyase subunit beta / citryl-CoA lyase
MEYNQLSRSLLFVPGHNEKYINKAIKSSADILLLDLEDSCQPKSNKVKAREIINSYLKKGLFKDKYLFPRINERESGEMLNDLKSLCNLGITGFMYPKAKNGKDTYFFGKLLELIEREKGIEVGHFKIILLIETTSSIFNIQEIINGCKNRVIAVAFGHLDYLSDLQAESTLDSTNFQVARTLCAAGARVMWSYTYRYNSSRKCPRLRSFRKENQRRKSSWL